MKRLWSNSSGCVVIFYLALAASPLRCHCYPIGIFSEHGIDLHGNNLAVDSYDSTDPTKSTGGQYDPSKAGDLGDVACSGGITNSLPVGSALIYGHLFIASNSPAMLGPSGGVGTHAWLTSNTGIEPGYELSGFNFSFPDTTPPYSGGLVPPGGGYVTIGGVTRWYDHILYNGDYYAISLAGNTVVLGPSRLVLVYGLNMVGNDSITISSGSSLIIYSVGSTCTIGGSGISNQDSLPSAFVVYCSPAVSNLTLNANGSFIGVVVAPSADAVMNAAGSVVNEFGALMVQSLRLNGSFDFHFDESLFARLQTSLPSNDLFQFQVVGVPGFHYAVEASTNLTSWVSLFTNTLPFTFVDTNGSFLNRRFYRAMFHP